MTPHPVLRMGGPTALILVGLMHTAPALAVSHTYDFEGLAAGTVVAGQTTTGAQLASDPYPGFEFTVVGNQTSSSLVIFDTAHPTGGDVDLGTPNQYYGGPGRGVGGQPGMPGENRVPRKMVLIIPENMGDVNQDGRVDAPDDNEYGGVINIAWEVPGILQTMSFIDIEEEGAFVDCYFNNRLIQSFPIPALGDNSQVTINCITTQLINRTVVNFPGSGALAEMTYNFGVVPVEGMTWGGIKSLLD